MGLFRRKEKVDYKKQMAESAVTYLMETAELLRKDCKFVFDVCPPPFVKDNFTWEELEPIVLERQKEK